MEEEGAESYVGSGETQGTSPQTDAAPSCVLYAKIATSGRGTVWANSAKRHEQQGRVVHRDRRDIKPLPCTVYRVPSTVVETITNAANMDTHVNSTVALLVADSIAEKIL